MKRFTDPNKWFDPWFVELTPIHKLIWLFLCDSCDIAGFWPVSKRMLGYYVGASVTDWDAFVPAAGERRLRIVDFSGEPKAWLVKFIAFQFPRGLGSRGPVMVAVRRALAQAPLQQLTKDIQEPYLTIISNLHEDGRQELINGIPTLSQPLAKGCITLQDKEKDKDKVLSSSLLLSSSLPEIPPMPRKEFDAMAAIRGVTPEFAEWFWNINDGANWVDSHRRPIVRVEAALLAAWSSAKSNGSVKKHMKAAAGLPREVNEWDPKLNKYVPIKQSKP